MHASLRRVLISRGVHTHGETFAEASTDVVIRRAKKRGQMHGGMFVLGAPVDPEEDGGDDPDGPPGLLPSREHTEGRQGGSGGEWRLFCRQETLGKKRPFDW